MPHRVDRSHGGENCVSWVRRFELHLKSSRCWTLLTAMGMEVNVLNELPGGGGILTVSTHPNATVDSLIGAACQDKKLSHLPSIGLYTKDNRLLSTRGSLRAQNIRPGDTLYLRYKQSEDEFLYYTNWKVLAFLCGITGVCGLGFAFVVFFFTGGQVPFVYGIVVEVGASYTEATLYHWEGSKTGGTGQVHHVRRVETTHMQPPGLAGRDGSTAAGDSPAGVSSGAGRASRDISGLLDTLKEYVPEAQRPTTPIYLLATEGLRLSKRPAIPKPSEVRSTTTTTQRPPRPRGRMRGRNKMHRWGALIFDTAATTGQARDQYPTSPHRSYALRAQNDGRRSKKQDSVSFLRSDDLRSIGVKVRNGVDDDDNNDDNDDAGENSSSSEDVSGISAGEAAVETMSGTSRGASPRKKPRSRWRRGAVQRRSQRKVDSHSAGNVQEEQDGVSTTSDADTALMAVECALRSSGFNFRSAGVLSGRDEGLYGWLSTNYLLGRIPQYSAKKGARELLYSGSLALSGASAQIAFEVGETESNRPEVSRLQLFGREHFVYSRSSLCFGVNQAYLRYLARILHDNKYSTDRPVESPCHHRGQLVEISLERIFATQCTHTPKMDVAILLRLNESVTFNGTSDPEGCRALTEDLVDSPLCAEQGYRQCFRPLRQRVPNTIDYMAFAEFYEAARDINFTQGSLANFSRTTDHFCTATKQQLGKWQLFADDDAGPTSCFRLNYVLRLLRDKYDFDEDTFRNINFANSEGGYRLGWSLGFMINATNSLPAAPPVPPMITNELFALMVFMFAILVVFGVVFGCLSKRRELVMRNGVKSEIP